MSIINKNEVNVKKLTASEQKNVKGGIAPFVIVAALAAAALLSGCQNAGEINNNCQNGKD